MSRSRSPLRAIVLGVVALAMTCLTSGVHAAETAHYRLKARFDPEASRLAAEVEISLPAAEVRRPLALVLGRRFALSAVEASGGARVRVEPTDLPIPNLQSIVVEQDGPARAVTLRLSYAGPVTAAGDGFTRERVELNLEDFWLPIREDLGLYFSIEADIEGLPQGVTAVAQGRLRQTGAKLHISRSRPDQDLTLVGGPGMTIAKGRDVEFHAANQDDPLVATLREQAFASAAFFRKLYGRPEAGDVRMAIVPRASSGGYARSGFIVMPTFRKPDDPPPPFTAASVGRFVSHEFSHAWLPAAEPGGENYWVSESVAEYLALRYVEATFGAEERDEMLARKRQAAANAGPMIAATRPGSAALYQKGPVLLFDLERRIGRPAVDKILLRRDRPRTSAAFLAALETAAGAPTAQAFAENLRRQGLPTAPDVAPGAPGAPPVAGKTD